MKSSFRFLVLSTLVLVVLFASGNIIPNVAGAAPTFRWDTISLTFPGGVPTTGGGTWATSGASGTAGGTFTVTGLVKFTPAPGSLPPGFVDNIGDPASTRSGLVILSVKYSDGSRGTLAVSCHQPVGSPSGIFEGISATKGFVGFHERVPPVPGVDANRT